MAVLIVVGCTNAFTKDDLPALASNQTEAASLLKAFAKDKATDPKPQETKAQIPGGAKGFAGMITGKVVSKGEDQVLVEVSKIDRTWKHSKAENAESLVGKLVTIKIVPQTYAKKKGYLAHVRKFFGLLKAGDSNSFDVKHAEGDNLIFLELTKAQAEQVEKARQ